MTPQDVGEETVDPSRIEIGSTTVGAVMADLARHRSVFHSEADLQFSFAQTVERLSYGRVRCRLEAPIRDPESGRTTYLDLLCLAESGDVGIEFKYFTRSWTGSAQGETYSLRNHAASDLARLYFVSDVSRLEALTAARSCQGVALMMSNEPRLWQPPGPRARARNDRAFGIHEGASLSGELRWGNGYAANTRTLRGRYDAVWRDFSAPDPGVPGGTLRWLALAVGPAAGGTAT
ncbi:hypothetical protein [Pseudactinotalea terrae]|uniref:hypothetical protein n=1 Tax=Pseudactinotalea terrae TaxID=1743262 RepID=UPI0019D5C684|nr:hypothetical protein [Pseudactinotalea terrae]